MVAEYITSRIRQPLPGEFVVPQSTPVIAFGNAQTARIATLGLNPSRAEFVDANGNLLSDEDRRLSTNISLGLTSIEDASDSDIQTIVNDCNTYFHRNPYRKWFDQLDAILRLCGGSYYDNTACHLDLVQWATYPVWSGLESDVKKQLLKNDVSFLHQQMLDSQLDCILINGRGVLTHFRQSFDIRWQESEAIKGFHKHDIELFNGWFNDRIRVIAWTINIQSSYGVSNRLREELGNRCAHLLSRRTLA
ncbi:hypothetical protein [Microcystis aeruginosa]|jgi:hypothetical protein|nr:hypothetical protein [Microcystis aeruginosa]MBE8993116.1 hypothetical protein [Microcystis aeruginosa LEGE 91341]NCS24285.1 hypothetical protein [Microcystis aeruginosa BS13-02]